VYFWGHEHKYRKNVAAADGLRSKTLTTTTSTTDDDQDQDADERGN
jgi:hypothetical protein